MSNGVKISASDREVNRNVVSSAYSVGHYPNTALFNPPKNFPEQGSGLSSLGRIMLLLLKKQAGCVMVYPCFCPKRWQIFQTGCSTIFVCPVDRSWCAQRCCDGAATESLLQRSRCCDGDAQTSSVALILRVASATQLMLLRRS